jgi:4-aminobutyrate aminotransferase
LTNHIDADTKKWLARDSNAFLHQSLSTPCLDVLASCSGSEMRSLGGNCYLDFHGNSVHQVGFGNERVLAAMRQQLEVLPFCTRRYTNIPAILLAEKLAELTDGMLGKTLFAPGATSAIGMALKLARLVTGRFKTISMWDSFHGASLDAISIGGEPLFRKGIGPLMPGTEHVPPADPYNCVLEPSGNCSACGLKCARFLGYVLDKEQDVAAVIAEPIRCTVVNPPPAGYWQMVRQECDKYGTLLIFDETAVCLGRTGKMFAYQHYGVEPDMLVLGKGLGGGIMPLAALLTRKEYDIGGNTALGHYTHEKNPLSCAAALAVIQEIEEKDLVQRSATLGRYMADRLEDMAGRYPIIGRVQGQGLMVGIRLVTDRNARTPAVDEAEKIMYMALSRGLSFKISQGNCLTLTPPLTVSMEELDKALSILEECLLSVHG